MSDRNWLRQLLVKRVALVDRGANPKADIVLFKRDVEKASPDSADVHVNGPLGAKKKKDKLNPDDVKMPPGKVKGGGKTSATPYMKTECDCGYLAKHAGAGSCPFCTGSLRKRDYSKDERDAMAKSGEALSDGSFPIKTVADLSNAVQAFGRASNQGAAKAHIIKRAKALGATDKLPEGWNVSKRKEDSMPQFDKSALTDEQREHVEKLEADLAETQEKLEAAETAASAAEGAEGASEEASEDEVLKSLPEDIRKRLESAEERAAHAEEIAKSERDKNADREAIAKAEAWKPVGVNPVEFGPQLRKMAEADAELATEVERVLTAASEQVKEAKLFEELGKGWGGGGSDPLAKLDILAKGYVEKGEAKTEAEGFDLALKTSEGAKLYGEYTEAKGV